MKNDAYDIDDLARFSPWPQRLLGLAKWEQKKKNSQALTREFNIDKWGMLLNKAQTHSKKLSVEQVDYWDVESADSSLIFSHGQYLLKDAIEAKKLYKQMIAKELSSYLPSNNLVELGAGYGSVILDITRNEAFQNIDLYAGEYATNGIRLIEKIACDQKQKIMTGKCDFNKLPLVDFTIPENAIIFTSMALHYVPILQLNLIEYLIQQRPKVVIHFEPCYEHLDDNSLMGLMRQRYIQVNDYNTNLLSIIHKAQKNSLIQIIKEDALVFGTNPFLPISIVAWSPK